VTRRWCIRNRLTDQVVTRGPLAVLRCRLPMWREFYTRHGIAHELAVELAPPAPVEYGHVGDEPDDDTAALGL
jgi:hypothetical protein